MTEERRIVTVLFSDVSGSTEIGEALDPEDVRALLSRYYALAKEVVSSHGGTLEKFIGDAVMAIFGLPIAHGDDPQRALSAALELRDRVRKDETLGGRLPLRIGVNTGEVVAAREPSEGDFLVTGDPVNIAARLQQSAEPWQIVCGERTLRAAGAAFLFGAIGEIAAKGKRVAVRAATLVGRGTNARMRVPLIGREGELDQLELVARRAFAQHRAQLVSVIAPAGTGKTRLLEEFLERLPELAAGASVAIAQCLPYGQRLTYWPLRAVLFRLAGIPDDAPSAAVRQRIREWLGDAGGESQRVSELLATTIGAGETDVVDRAALLDAWRSAIEHAAARGPLVVVFEDLHWSSDSLLDLVEFVMQPRGDLPVLMLVLTRPELLDRRPTWGGGMRNYVALALEPLPAAAVVELVTHLLEASAPAVVSRIVARAEGNPFFAGELVRSLLDRVSSLDDEAAVERALASLPDTIQATVLARLDLLTPGERRVLQLGAVLGRTFRLAQILVLDPSVGDASQAVRALLDRDLVRAAGPDTFTFRHILIRDVAYRMLPRGECARLHASAARWLEKFAAGREEAFVELIAYHWREAASHVGPLEDVAELTTARAEATRWLARAAEIALAGAADVEAARHLQGAIELAEPEALPELYERLGDAYGYGERCLEAYSTSLRLCTERRRTADQSLRVLAGELGVRLRFPLSQGEHDADRVARIRSEGRDLLTRSTDERAIATFLIADGFYSFWTAFQREPTTGEIDQAEQSARSGLALAERLGDERLQSAALDAIGSIAAQRGDTAQSGAVALRRLALTRLPLSERLDAYAVAAWMSVWLGDLEEAIRLSSQALAAAQPGQLPRWVLHVVTWRTHALFLRGGWDAAATSGERAVQLWNESGPSAATYAQHGFASALQIARARRQQASVDQLRGVINSIAKQSPLDARARSWAAFAAGDSRAMTALVQSAEAPGPNLLQFVLSHLCDVGEPPSASAVRELGARVKVKSMPLDLHVERALGLTMRDQATLARALDGFSKIGAEPSVARVRCELALITRDDHEFATGLRALEALGDIAQVERYERRRPA